MKRNGLRLYLNNLLQKSKKKLNFNRNTNKLAKTKNFLLILRAIFKASKASTIF